MNDIETVLCGAGTTTCRVVTRALRGLVGSPATVHAVLAGCEPSAEVGLDGTLDRATYEQLPPAAAVYRAVTDRPFDFPWIGEEATEHIAYLARQGGRGVGGSPAAGRAAFALGARPLHDRLRDIGREAHRRRREVQVVLVVNTAGGTSRGSLQEIGLLAKSALPTAKRRMVLVLPHLGKGVFNHEIQRRARNALTALGILEEGVIHRPRWHHDRDGLVLSEPASLADEILVVSPRYQLDPRAEVLALEGLAEIEVAVARLLEGIAGRTPTWRAVEDRLVDQRELAAEDVGEDRPRFRWLSAGNEGRIWLDPARVHAAVREGLLSPAAP